jgi:hypothetical protein
MKTAAFFVLALLTFAVALGAVWLTWQFAPMEGRRVDCSIAEISPDYPPEVRQACRERRRVRT